ENVRLRVLGDFSSLTPDVQESLRVAMETLSGNTGLQLNLALSYGSRQEIIQAAKRLAQDCLEGKVQSDLIDESVFQRYLFTSDLGVLSDVDLVIRTSGEIRTSNFLLWQSAYAEYVFLDLPW